MPSEIPRKGRPMTTHSQPHSTFLTVNGLRLHYFDWGNAGAPPVVCVHGYTSSAEAFNAPARHFQDRFHFIVPDVRGHGESAWSPTGAYQYSDQVSDLEGMVTQLGLERFTLIGTSMGGIIAMAYAGAHPERLARLVINDIGPDAEVGSQRITQMVGDRPEVFATLEDAMATAAVCRPSWPDVARRTSGNLPSACSGNRRMAAGSGSSIQHTSSSGCSTARRSAPRRGPRSSVCSARPWWCGVWRAMSSRRHKPGVWSRSCHEGSWWPCPVWGTRRR